MKDIHPYFDMVIVFDYFTLNQKMPNREDALTRHQILKIPFS